MANKSVARELRVREKLLTSGVDSLSDVELLAALISSGSAKKSCIQLAFDLIQQFGDLRSVLNADAQSFLKIPGLGIVKYVQFQAAREMCRRSDFINLQKKPPITNCEQTHVFLKRQLRDKKNETFSALFLDNQHRVISYQELFTGTINSATIHARPILEKALNLNAAALILAHNHPSGFSQASPQDLEVTKRLQQSLELIDVRLLDHLVVGDNEIYSIFRGNKWVCY